MAPTKGKQPTKGARQILEENKSTIKFYRTMSLCAFTLHIVIVFFIFQDTYNITNIVLNVMVGCFYIIAHQAMVHMSRPKYNDNMQLLDAGLDLNMEGALGEHIKDIVILSSITQVAAIFSTYFWLLLLLLPVRVFWLVWKNFLGPWFFQQAPENPEQDDKKKKKIERKMKRMQ